MKLAQLEVENALVANEAAVAAANGKRPQPKAL
jgi:hypothetical protein